MARSKNERQSGGTALLVELVPLQGIYPGGLVWKQSNTIIVSFREKNVDLSSGVSLVVDQDLERWMGRSETLEQLRSQYQNHLCFLCLFVA